MNTHEKAQNFINAVSNLVDSANELSVAWSDDDFTADDAFDTGKLADLVKMSFDEWAHQLMLARNDLEVQLDEINKTS